MFMANKFPPIHFVPNRMNGECQIHSLPAIIKLNLASLPKPKSIIILSPKNSTKGPNRCQLSNHRAIWDFDVKCIAIQFYGKSHNSQSDHWIRLKFYMESPDMLSYLGFKFQINLSLRRHRNMGQKRLYEFCYLLPFDLWTSYLAKILFLKGCGSLFWESPNSSKIFNGLQHSFHMWQGFMNVSEFFSYKDSLFILATKGKKTSE